jgi:hypothetical protein
MGQKAFLTERDLLATMDHQLPRRLDERCGIIDAHDKIAVAAHFKGEAPNGRADVERHPDTAVHQGGPFAVGRRSLPVPQNIAKVAP